MNSLCLENLRFTEFRLTGSGCFFKIKAIQVFSKSWDSDNKHWIFWQLLVLYCQSSMTLLLLQQFLFLNEGTWDFVDCIVIFVLILAFGFGKHLLVATLLCACLFCYKSHADVGWLGWVVFIWLNAFFMILRLADLESVSDHGKRFIYEPWYFGWF